MTDSKIAAALETACNRTQLGHTIETEGDILVPEADDDLSDLESTLTRIVHPSHELLKIVMEEPEADEVDGARPRVNARKYVWNVSDDDEMAFRVLGEWENTYDDKRVSVETPAPWDVPDDFDGQDPNDLIKDLPWKDEEADNGTGAYYTFDDDNRAAPSYAEEAWSLDAAKLDELRELAESEGYGWEDTREEESSDEQVSDLLDYAQDGDRVEVTYAKKNGNGLNTYSGKVTACCVYTSRSTGFNMSSSETWGLVFEDEDGKVKRVKEGDDGEVSLFSNGRYPFMGEVVTVTVGPSSTDLDDAVLYDTEDDEEEDEAATDVDAGSDEAAACELDEDDEDDDESDLDDEWAVFA